MQDLLCLQYLVPFIVFTLLLLLLIYCVHVCLSATVNKVIQKLRMLREDQLNERQQLGQKMLSATAIL